VKKVFSASFLQPLLLFSPPRARYSFKTRVQIVSAE